MTKQIAVAIVFSSACSAAVGSGRVDGTVDGAAVHVADAISGVDGDPSANAALVVMASDGNLCNDLVSYVVHPNEQLELIELADVAKTTGSDSSPSSAATYPVPTNGDTRGAAIAVEQLGPNCEVVSQYAAGSGLVTLTTADPDSGIFAGSFAVTLDDAGGDPLTGSFSPEACPGLSAAEAYQEASGLAPTCE